MRSVAKVRPFVSRQIKKASMVPNASAPASALRFTAASCSSSHRTFVAEKYGSRTRPVFWYSHGSSPW